MDHTSRPLARSAFGAAWPSAFGGGVVALRPARITLAQVH